MNSHQSSVLRIRRRGRAEIRPPDRCRVLPWRSRSGGACAIRDSDAPLGAPLTVIFARRENGRARGGRPGQLPAGRRPVGALLRDLPASRCGPADLVAAPSPEGSRPSGLGMPPAPESARCLPTSFALASFPVSSRYPSVVPCPLRPTRPGAGRPGAPGGRALEAVEKVVTLRRASRGEGFTLRICAGSRLT